MLVAKLEKGHAELQKVTTNIFYDSALISFDRSDQRRAEDSHMSSRT